MTLEEFNTPGNEAAALRELANAFHRLFAETDSYSDDAALLLRAADRLEHPPTPQLEERAMIVTCEDGVMRKVVPFSIAAEFEHLVQLTLVDDVKLAAENQRLETQLRFARLGARLSVESAAKFEEQAFLMRELCGYLIRVGTHPLPAYPRYCRTLQYIRSTNARDADD